MPFYEEHPAPHEHHFSPYDKSPVLSRFRSLSIKDLIGFRSFKAPSIGYYVMMREHDSSSSRTLSGRTRQVFPSTAPLSAVFAKYIQEEVFTHSISALLHFRFLAFLFFFPSFSFEDRFGVYDASGGSEPRLCSYFQARKNPGRCFISDRISRRNLEQVTARICTRLPPSCSHLPSCPHVPRPQPSSSSPAPSTPRRVARSALLFAKCLRSGRSCRLPARRRGPFAEIDEVAEVYPNPFFHGEHLRESSIYQRSPRSNHSRRARLPDISYALSVVVMDGISGRSLGVDHYTNVGDGFMDRPKVIPIGMHLTPSRLYWHFMGDSREQMVDGDITDL